MRTKKRKPRDEEFRKQLIEEYDLPELLFMDDYDDCIVGVVESFGGKQAVCYDFEAVIHALRVREKMSEEDALEWWGYNMIGAYVGDHTPVFIRMISRRTG